MTGTWLPGLTSEPPTAQAVAVRRERFGADHIATLDRMFRVCARHVEDWQVHEGTLNWLREVLVHRRHSLGDEHVDTLAAMRLLCICYSEEYPEHPELEGEAVDEIFTVWTSTLERLHGLENDATQEALLLYSDFLHLRNEEYDRDNAIELANLVVTAREEALGRGHPSTQIAISKLRHHEYEYRADEEDLCHTEEENAETDPNQMFFDPCVSTAHACRMSTGCLTRQLGQRYRGRTLRGGHVAGPDAL